MRSATPQAPLHPLCCQRLLLPAAGHITRHPSESAADLPPVQPAGQPPTQPEVAKSCKTPSALHVATPTKRHHIGRCTIKTVTLSFVAQPLHNVSYCLGCVNSQADRTPRHDWGDGHREWHSDWQQSFCAQEGDCKGGPAARQSLCQPRPLFWVCIRPQVILCACTACTALGSWCIQKHGVHADMHSLMVSASSSCSNREQRAAAWALTAEKTILDQVVLQIDFPLHCYITSCISRD